MSSDRSACAEKRRAFRPLIIYLIVALPVLGWDIHRRQAARTFVRVTVNLEGKSLEGPLQVEVDGKAASLDAPVPIGSRQIKLWSRDTEEWSTNRFVWYGENPLGTIRLERSRGDLRVAVKPAPIRVALTGRLTNAVSDTAEPTFRGLAVGDYRLELRFPHFTRTVVASVARNTVSTVDRSFPVGHLRIESEPTGASYDLQSQGSERVQLRGQAPAEVGGLPPGEYRLVLARGDYTLARTVTLGGGQTNVTRVEFAYGKVDIATEPAAATISLNNQDKGATPLVLESLMPGRYIVRAAREGFHPVQWVVDVKGNETVKVSTNLLSIRYTEAMKKAKGHLLGFSTNYRAALNELAEASAAKPGDAEAAKLTLDAQFFSHNHDARTALSAGQLTNALQAVEAALAMRPQSTEATGLKADIERAVRLGEQRVAMEAKRKADQAAEAQKKEDARLAAEAKRKADMERAAENQRRTQLVDAKFNQVVQKLPKGNVPQRWTTTATVAEVEAALGKALGQTPDSWKQRGTAIRDDDVVQIPIEGAGVAVAEISRLGLVQLAQVDGATDVRLVFWNATTQLLPGLTLRLGGQGNDALEPVARAFRQRLERQLGKPLR